MAAEDKRRHESEMHDYKLTTSDSDKKKKIKKDPDAPKRARSAYTFFMSTVRQSVCDENPNCDFAEVSNASPLYPEE
jgi:hypothetical protein